MENIGNMPQLYAELLSDLYNAEVVLVAELLMVNKLAKDPLLQSGLIEYLNYSRAHVQRLEDLLEAVDRSLFEEHCRSMRSMINEAKQLIHRCENGPVRDFAIVSSLQRINGCKTTVYSNLMSLSSQLGYNKQQPTLEKCLKEEQLIKGFLEERIRHIQQIKELEI